MKYIRTKELGEEKIFILSNSPIDNELWVLESKDVFIPIHSVVEPEFFGKIADTIEELCDVLIVKTKNYKGFKGKIELADLRNACGTKESLHKYLISQMKRNDLFDFAFLGIETQKGLIYVAKLNDKGELELL